MADTPAQVLHDVIAAAEGAGRADLVARLRVGLERARRSETVVCVVGEFKQGKSSLVNALLEAELCPVDDDLATAVPTVVRQGSAPTVTVHTRRGGQAHAEVVAPSELADWVTEQGNPDNERGVEQVEVALDHPLLDDGLVLVDTPGVGGLSAGHAAATAAFLPYADALLFVTDASAELTAPEVAFLSDAVERCPRVVVVLTKTDLYPAWRRIGELDAGHLAEAGLAAPILPASAAALAAALALGDADLVDGSGIPALRRLLRDDVLDPGRDRAAVVLVDEGRAVVEHLAAATDEQLRLVRDPAAARAARQRYEDLAARLQELREGSARWQQVLSDGIADLSNQTSFRFRAELRQLGRDLDEQVEQLRTPEEWDELGATLQRRVAELASGLFADVDRQVEDLAERIRAEVRDELAWSGEGRGDGGDPVADLVAAELSLPEAQRGLRAAAGGTVTALRGAQSGLLLFGLLGRYLPMGAAALLFSNPVTLVLGAAFAGKQVLNVRRQNLTARRQQARAAVRTFLDDFQFEASNRLGEVLRARSRDLRDQVGSRVAELQATARDLAEEARREAAAEEAEQARLVADLEATRVALGAVAPRLDALAGQLASRAPALAPEAGS